MNIQVSVLGQLEVLRGGVAITPSPPKLRQVLALLAVSANSVVRTDELMAELWDGTPPPTATTTLQTYVSHLRKLFGATGRNTPESASVVLHTHRVGYSLTLPPGTLDVQRFAELAQRGRGELDNGLLEEAAESLRGALAVWRGPALSDVDPGPVLRGHIARLAESRASVTEQRMEVELMLGRHHQLVGELTTLAEAHPTHEGLHTKLMLALHRSGRRSEALRVFQRLRATLVDRLGLEPGPELQRLHRTLLNGGDETEPAPPLTAQVRPNPPGWAEPPAQLPPDLPAFVGRARELAEVEALLSAAPTTAPPVVSVVGPPGVGKSAFSTHVANRIRGRFPHGQLYADLAETEPEEALAGFLRAIRGPNTPLPADLRERSQLFRSWTVQRKVIVVLDNACSAAQIAPLVPSGQGCAVLVACRRRVPFRGAALTVDLAPLDDRESLELLTSVVGTPRVEADPAAADTLVDLCGGLPLALLAAATRLTLRPHWSIGRLADRLVSEEQRLRELASGKLDVRASVEANFRLLAGRYRTAFVRLGSLPGGPISVEQAALALGTDEEAAEAILERLVEFQLAEVADAEPEHHGAYFRYQFHPLMQLAARALAAAGVLEASPLQLPLAHPQG
ncbi:DNA-binding SARP family transcriptional activator [Crossiella equi]|uniref:DNA-binding SARP family transcriptional activator n=1 Tax=Crossiella equi TaxID=130796 RepID=A0ABS5A975_9PSEU|nr:AfsR/SARP family transcriptional regulator [Crossiella equi]MBP2472857.1 DNA-binding SARP family transcriptional activator [Crossiella equi]